MRPEWLKSSVEKLSEKGWRILRCSLTEHRNGTFGPILASLRLSNPRSECCSYPFSDSFRRGILGSWRRGGSRKYVRWWSTHPPRLSRYSHRPGRSPLVGETTPGEHDDRHCEHREHRQAH